MRENKNKLKEYEHGITCFPHLNGFQNLAELEFVLVLHSRQAEDGGGLFVHDLRKMHVEQYTHQHHSII